MKCSLVFFLIEPEDEWNIVLRLSELISRSSQMLLSS